MPAPPVNWVEAELEGRKRAYELKYIVVHCSQSPNGRKDTVEDIRRWHKEQGWNDIGYHFVIERGGELKFGRSEREAGAHVLHYNDESLGICLIGTDKFTRKQKKTLHYLLKALQERYNMPTSSIVGHYELDSKKTCPNIDMDKYRKDYDNTH